MAKRKYDQVEVNRWLERIIERLDELYKPSWTPERKDNYSAFRSSICKNVCEKPKSGTLAVWKGIHTPVTSRTNNGH
jgi:hypothetical protein